MTGRAAQERAASRHRLPGRVSRRAGVRDSVPAPRRTVSRAALGNEPTEEAMAFTYTVDDLQKWLRHHPEHGQGLAFVLDRMAVLGHGFQVVDSLFGAGGPDFDGRYPTIRVLGGARDATQAAERAINGLRQWACGGIGGWN